MLAFFLSILGIGRSIGTAVITWLSKRSLAELASLALVIVCLVLFLSLKAEERHSAKLQTQLTAATQRLSTIADSAAKAERDGKQISKQIKDRNDEDNRRIAGDAQSVRLRGPGKALCSPAPAASSGHEPASGIGNAPGPQVSPADSAAVPWPWLVQRAEQADLNRAEVLAWREWYRRLVESWPKDTGAAASQR